MNVDLCYKLFSVTLSYACIEIWLSLPQFCYESQIFGKSEVVIRQIQAGQSIKSRWTISNISFIRYHLFIIHTHTVNTRYLAENLYSTQWIHVVSASLFTPLPLNQFKAFCSTIQGWIFSENKLIYSLFGSLSRRYTLISGSLHPCRAYTLLKIILFKSAK